MILWITLKTNESRIIFRRSICTIFCLKIYSYSDFYELIPPIYKNQFCKNQFCFFFFRMCMIYNFVWFCESSIFFHEIFDSSAAVRFRSRDKSKVQKYIWKRNVCSRNSILHIRSNKRCRVPGKVFADDWWEIHCEHTFVEWKCQCLIFHCIESASLRIEHRNLFKICKKDSCNIFNLLFN